VWYDFFKLLWLSFQKEPPPGIGGICCGPFIPDLRYSHVIKRPKCGRCHGPLDFFPDPDTGRYGWCCNNPEPMMTDEEFKRRWDELPGDDVAKLTREA
jgi:hypothetical protein